MYQLLIHSLVLTTMLYATPFCRSAEAIYNPPDLTKPVFDIDKIGLTEAEQKAIATVLTEFVRNGNTMAHDHLDFCSRALAIALRLDPTNKSAVVADAQLREGQQPKFKNVSVTNADLPYSFSITPVKSVRRGATTTCCLPATCCPSPARLIRPMKTPCLHWQSAGRRAGNTTGA